MSTGQIVVLVWAINKLLPEKQQNGEPEKKQIKNTVVDMDAAKQWNWGLWLFWVITAIVAVVCLIIANHPFIAGCIGGLALFVLSIPVRTILKEEN